MSGDSFYFKKFPILLALHSSPGEDPGNKEVLISVFQGGLVFRLWEDCVTGKWSPKGTYANMSEDIIDFEGGPENRREQGKFNAG